MPPLRDTALVQRCDQCDEIASARCKRCDRPACGDHEPARGRRCADCQLVLDERLAAITPADVREQLAWYARLLGIVFVGSGAALGGLGAIVVIVLLVAGQVTVGSALLGVLIMAVCAGTIGALLCAVFTLPFMSFTGVQALRLHLARRRFLAERPGARRLPSADQL